MRKSRLGLLAALVVLMIWCGGCKLPPGFLQDASRHQATGIETAQLWVTTDYGTRLLWAGTVRFSAGESVLAVMKRYVKTDTIYGGGFVQNINGYPDNLPGGRGGRDWFIYLDGVLAEKGASDIACKAGQVIWWDCHVWEGTAFVHAAIGAFPKPFGNNKETRVWYTGLEGGIARKAAAILNSRGIKASAGQIQADWRPYGSSGPAVVVGRWRDLYRVKYLQNYMAEPLRSGVFCICQGGAMAALNDRGEEARKLPSGSGCIMACAGRPGDPAPVWIITAMDREGLERAVKYWGEHQQALKYRFGLAVTPEGPVALPVTGKAGFEGEGGV